MHTRYELKIIWKFSVATEFPVYPLLLPLGPIVPSESSGKGQEANHHKQPESTINEGVFPVQDIIAGTPGLETSSSTHVFRKMIVLKNI